MRGPKGRSPKLRLELASLNPRCGLKSGAIGKLCCDGAEFGGLKRAKPSLAR